MFHEPGEWKGEKMTDNKRLVAEAIEFIRALFSE